MANTPGAAMSGGRGALQAVVAVLAATPVATGFAGLLIGPDFLGLDPPWPRDLDSHFRFLSGILLAMGLGWWSCVPGIERKTERFRLLAFLTFAGGLARLLSLALSGAPSAGHLFGLTVEVAVVPLLVFWQTRVAANPR
jgi:hypothetical protein